MGLHSLAGRALERECRGLVFEPIEAPKIFFFFFFFGYFAIVQIVIAKVMVSSSFQTTVNSRYNFITHNSFSRN